MATYAHPDTLDGGLLFIKNNATRMILISAYTNVYVTALSTALATVVIAPTDLIITTSGANRLLTVASGKTATASATAGAGDLHIAFTDNVSKVLWVIDETTNQPITLGNTVNFPANMTYLANQPTSV